MEEKDVNVPQEQEQKQEETFTAKQLADKVGEAINGYKRKLSKEYGVNLFDAEKEKEFFTNKVDKSEYESVKTKYEETTNKVKEYEQQIKGFSDLTIENQLLRNNIKEDKLDLAKKIIKADYKDGTDLSELVKGFVEKTPEWKVRPAEKFGASFNNNGSELTEKQKWYKDKGMRVPD